MFFSHQRANADNAPPLPILGLGVVVDGAGLVGGAGHGNPRAGFLPQFLAACIVV